MENYLSNKNISTIFMGTPDFAVPILESLIKNGYALKAVVTQPDKEVGRKKIITPPPIKAWLKGAKLPIGSLAPKHPILQPTKLRDPQFIKQLKTINLDLIIVAAYGQILPKEIIELPKYGCINVHASLLPKHRGASPIQTAILNGNDETGVTVMKMDEGMDTGDIISQEKIKINKNDTSQTLHDKLSKVGAKLLIKTLPDYLSGKIKPVPQDNSQATETKILTKKDGQINFNKSAEEIERQLRAFTPWPGIYTFFDNKKLQILKIKIAGKPQLACTSSRQGPASYKTGQLYETEGKLMVNCKNSVLILEEVQLEGKNKISGKEFVNGYLK